MKRILIVDDDAICNFLMTKLLERTGESSEIQSALNGEEALELLNSCWQNSHTLPDLIFLDLNMPLMDGFAFLEVYNKLNFEGRKAMVVVVSSSGDEKDIERAKQLGIAHYLTKPLTLTQVKEVLSWT